MKIEIFDYRNPLCIFISFYLHELVMLFGTIKGHDVDTFKALDNFAVRMIQCRAHHVAANSDFNFTLGVLDQNGAVKGN